jgi:hypothetical protein
MSRFSLPALSLLALLSACSAALSKAETPVTPARIYAEAAPTQAIAPTPAAAAERGQAYAALSCEVRSRRTANGVLIHARARADRPITGDYDLVITKSGGGNSADISQSGRAALAAGVSTIIGESEISVERGTRLRAVLTLRDDSGQLCRRTFNL